MDKVLNLFTLLTNWLDTAGIWFGLITMVLVILTWWEVGIGRKRKMQELYKVAVEHQGDWPVILIANYLAKETDMKTDVEKFRRNHSTLNTVDKSRVFESNSFNILGSHRAVIPDDMPAVVEDIRRVAADISRTGTDAIHLFYGGPHIIASIIGKEFSNSHRVVLYQQEFVSKKYINYGPLTHHAI